MSPDRSRAFIWDLFRTSQEGRCPPSATRRSGSAPASTPPRGGRLRDGARVDARGRAFTDHPACVCPVIGSFLRAYNDSVDDERRQDLTATRRGSSAARVAQRGARPRRAPGRVELGELPAALRALLARPDRARDVHMRKPHPPGGARSPSRPRDPPAHRQSHAAALGLIEELLAIGYAERPAPDGSAGGRGARA